MVDVKKDQTFNPRSLPEFQGTEKEVTAFRRVVALYEEIRSGQGELTFDALLPQIIGYIPQQERDFFRSFVPLKGSSAKSFMIDANDTDFQRLIEGMPETYGLVLNDIALLSIPNLRLDSVVIDHKLTKAGKTPRPTKVWHIDPDPSYIITDSNPTNFYRGSARFVRVITGGITLDLESLRPKIRPVVAPPYAIVRQGSLNVHRSPVFEYDDYRTFMDFLTYNE